MVIQPVPVPSEPPRQLLANQCRSALRHASSGGIQHGQHGRANSDYLEFHAISRDTIFTMEGVRAGPPVPKARTQCTDLVARSVCQAAHIPGLKNTPRERRTKSVDGCAANQAAPKAPLPRRVCAGELLPVRRAAGPPFDYRTEHSGTQARRDRPHQPGPHCS